MQQIKQFDHINMTVSNLDESLSWYRRVFGFQQVERGEKEQGRWSIIRSGEAMLCLYERPQRRFLEPYDESIVHNVNHFAIRITDQDEWEAVIQKEDLEIKFGAAIDYPHSRSWYLIDPTGYEIEVVYWHQDQIRFPDAA